VVFLERPEQKAETSKFDAFCDVVLSGPMSRPAVFFDRDGVLNEDGGYVFEVHKFKWIDGAREAVKAVNDAGYFAFVVTNQSGVARGIYEEEHVHQLHRYMADELARIGAHINAFEYCPDHPEALVERYRRASNRRKPGPGMILDLVRRFPVDVTGSILIGDKESDIAAARAAGVKGYLFSGQNLEQFIVPLLTNGTEDS
jgi:D-glycero-D-manno-heptose 1,7-bisphosphate phosphatase